MDIFTKDQYAKQDLAYATVFDGFVTIWGTEGETQITFKSSEWAHIMDCVTKAGWHNDGSLVA